MANPAGVRRGAAVSEAERYLADHGVATPRADAELLLMHVMGTDRAGLYARRDPLDPAAADRLAGVLRLRAAGVPLQHLTGGQGFCGLDLRVRPGVFVPRPETEVVVAAALEAIGAAAAPLAVDVGTGTGAIALAVKARRPEARVVATDTAPAAVALARENAHLLGLEVEVLEGDLFDNVPRELRGRVDVVVSNPPYVAPEEYPELPPEVLADPVEALIGGTEVHARLSDQAFGWLRPGGWLVLEIGETQGDEVGALLADRYEAVEVGPDLAGRHRVVRGRRPAG